MTDLASACEYGARVCRALGMDPHAVQRVTMTVEPPYVAVAVRVDAYLTPEQADAIFEDIPIEACEVAVTPIETGGKPPKDTRPVCPVCGAVMVMFREEYSDGSGWKFGWLCNCTADLRDKE